MTAYEQLSEDEFNVIHAVSERFEADLRSGKPSPIESVYGSVPPHLQAILFDELLTTELQWKFSRRQAPKLAQLLDRFPNRMVEVRRIFALATEDSHSSRIEDASMPGIESAPQTDSLEQAGTVIGQYELLSLLGSGGMGSVWRAVQREPVHREVAIKLIKSGMDTRQVMARFAAERQALALMNHPHIASVLEAGATRLGRPYFVMELVEGSPITDFCDEHQLTLEERLKLFTEVCGAIQHAHQKGVIHRDIKPSNVLVSGDRQRHIPKVIDFGLAKATLQSRTEQSLQTVFGQRMGTPHYMSPEQANASNIDVDTRADVYSLGALLFELLSGVTPFDFQSLGATTIESMLQHICDHEPVRMGVRIAAMADTSRVALDRGMTQRQLRRQLGGDLEVIVQKALTADRQLRYQSASGFADDVQRFLNSEPIEARRKSIAYRLRKAAARNTKSVATVILVLIALMTATVVSTRQAIRAREAEAELAEQLRVSRELSFAAQERAKTERWERYCSVMDAISNSIGGKEDFELTRRRLASAPREHRGWEWTYFRNRIRDSSATMIDFQTDDFAYCPVFALHPTNSQLALHQPDGRSLFWEPSQSATPASGFPYLNQASAVAFSRDGRSVAVAADDHAIHVWDTESRRLLARLVGHQQAVIELAFHPNGTQLASGGFDQIQVWDVAKATAILSRKVASACTGLAYFGDGNRLVYSTGTEVTSLDPLSENSILKFETAASEITNATISPDENWWVAGTTQPENLVYVWDARTGQCRKKLSGHTKHVSKVVFDDQGRLLASVSLDQSARLWDSESWELRHICRGHTAYVYGVDFSADGTKLVTGSRDETARCWDTESGAQIAVLRGHRGQISQVALSHDDSRAITASFDGTVRTWDMTHLQSTKLRGHKSFVYDVAFHPFKNIVASVAWDGTVVQWDMDQQRVLTRESHPTRYVMSVAYGPLGANLVTLSRRSDDDKSGRTLSVWDQATGRLLKTVPVDGPNWLESRAAISRCKILAGANNTAHASCVAVGDDAGGVHLFNLETGQLIRSFLGHAKGIHDVAFHPRGERLASASFDDSLRVWDLLSGEEVAVLRGHKGAVQRVLFSSDGRLLASASMDKTVRIWDADQHQLLAELYHGSPIYGLAFSPCGSRLATACGDHTIRLWDLERFQQVATLNGHRDYVHAVAFSPDGTRLISGSGDATIRIWDTLPTSERMHHSTIIH